MWTAGLSLHTHAPNWTETFGIQELETMGTIFALTLAAEYAPGRNVLLCCDNLGAKGVVIRGHSTTAYGRGLAAVFWSVAECAAIHVWLEYVKSELNPSDDPSRMCIKLGQKMRKTPRI